MEDRLDPLIAERAPWLFRGGPATDVARKFLNRVLSYDRTVALARVFEPQPAHVIMDEMARLLAKDLVISGLDEIPRQGPALVVANHPTGIADGVILHAILSEVRKDAYFYANSDILRVLPQMGALICPVEWRLEKRTHAKTRETMSYTRSAVEAGRLGVIFPSGRLAKRRGLKLHERPWMASAAMIARKFDLPVIPVHISARNSVLFYLFDVIHPSLRDITLFHATLNKGAQPYRVTIGEAISPSALPKNSEEGIELLRNATLRLAGDYAPQVSLVQATKRPSWI